MDFALSPTRPATRRQIKHPLLPLSAAIAIPLIDNVAYSQSQRKS
jgi:hypothetical protein